MADEQPDRADSLSEADRSLARDRRWKQRLVYKLYGKPPPKGAPRLDRMRFIRRVSLRAMLAYVPIGVVVLALGTSEWATVTVCALFIFSIANVLAITLRIRSTEKAQRPPAP